MKWTPEPYQRRAVRHLLANPAAGLLLEPGLGKTSCVLRAFKTLLDQGAAKRMLVMAPLSVASTVWPAEVRKWDFAADLRVEVLHGPRKTEALQREAEVYVVNYDGLAWLDRQRWRWPEVLVADESTRLKNTRTQRFGYLKRRLADASRRVALTGTPSTNGLMDLFGQLYFLDMGTRLHPYITRFRNEFFTEIQPHEWLPHPDAETRIADRIGDICLYMSQREYLNLPARVERVREVILPVAARRRYAELEALFFLALDEGEVTAANAAVKSGKLRQLCGGAVYLDGREREWAAVHDAKTEALLDLLEEIGAPTFVLYEFDHERARIEEALRHLRVARVAGTPRKRAEAIDAWNAGALDVLLAHPASAGHGINLQQGGHHVVFFAPTWNLEHYEQAMDRIYRKGQRRKVFVHTLVVKDTIEEAVMAALGAKDRTQRKLLERIRARRRR